MRRSNGSGVRGARANELLVRWSVLAVAALLLVGSDPMALSGTALMMLPEGATTSAGIYDSEDRLIRTLWSGRFLSRGSVGVQWDGRDDDGASAPLTGKYRVRLLAHNIRYVWEGVIGNTSREFTGAHIHRALNAINDMALNNQHAVAARLRVSLIYY